MAEEYCGCDEGTRRTEDCPEHYYLAFLDGEENHIDREGEKK
jgi:hypothetical protein